LGIIVLQITVPHNIASEVDNWYTHFK
jgi:hypothetical protein